tara:strand:+ start:1008 stop:1226 length:219 start_codon:yes stop_codon:yes gene_type:complete
MVHDINFPTERTYVIAYTNIDNTAYYTWVNPDQCFETGQPNLWTSLDETEWLEELNNVFGIVPDPDDLPPNE